VYARLAAAGLIDKDGVLTDENEAARTSSSRRFWKVGRTALITLTVGSWTGLTPRSASRSATLIRKLVNFIRAAMLRRGFPLNINKLTVDDLVSFADRRGEGGGRGCEGYSG
jgi:hypothetical protein